MIGEKNNITLREYISIQEKRSRIYNKRSQSESGTSGTSGVNGTSGTSGISGTSGASGLGNI